LKISNEVPHFLFRKGRPGHRFLSHLFGHAARVVPHRRDNGYGLIKLLGALEIRSHIAPLTTHRMAPQTAFAGEEFLPSAGIAWSCKVLD
jgi:hypothetical protein